MLITKVLSTRLPGADDTGKTAEKIPAAQAPAIMANGRKVEPEGSSVVPAGLKPTARAAKTSQITFPGDVTVLSARGDFDAALAKSAVLRAESTVLCAKSTVLRAEAAATRARGDAARVKANAALAKTYTIY
jgi:hypothetical protein